MKRSRVALLLFMATFACSLLAAGMAGGEGGAVAQQLAGGSAGGGYCEFAYDPVDEEPRTIRATSGGGNLPTHSQRLRWPRL